MPVDHPGHEQSDTDPVVAWAIAANSVQPSKSTGWRPSESVVARWSNAQQWSNRASSATCQTRRNESMAPRVRV